MDCSIAVQKQFSRFFKQLFLIPANTLIQFHFLLNCPRYQERQPQHQPPHIPRQIPLGLLNVHQRQPRRLRRPVPLPADHAHILQPLPAHHPPPLANYGGSPQHTHLLPAPPRHQQQTRRHGAQPRTQLSQGLRALLRHKSAAAPGPVPPGGAQQQAHASQRGLSTNLGRKAMHRAVPPRLFEGKRTGGSYHPAAARELLQGLAAEMCNYLFLNSIT